MTKMFPSRKARGRDESGAGIIVFLMMALVFVPIVTVHAAMLWRGPPGFEQLAAMMDALFARF